MADLFFFFFFVHFEWHFFMQANNVILIRPDKIAKPNRTKLHWRNANRIIFSLAVLCNDSHVMSVTSVFSHWQLNARYTPRLFWEQGGTQFILACRQCRILTSSSEIKLHASPVKEREKKEERRAKHRVVSWLREIVTKQNGTYLALLPNTSIAKMTWQVEEIM